MRLRNTGQYPIRISKVLVGEGSLNQFWGTSGCTNFSDYFYMAPGEEKAITSAGSPVVKLNIRTGTALQDRCQYNGGASIVCQNATGNQGIAVINTFGFEYIEYIEGQQITKRQIGAKPLVIKCT